MKIPKIYDIETYKNLFTFVAKTPGEKEYDVFTIFDQDETNQGEDLYHYLISKKYIFIGFNNIEFDSPVLECLIQKKGKITARELYDYAQAIINEEIKKIPFYKFNTIQVDLYKMWSFDTTQRRTSLKWLEFSMRMKKLKDLPFEHFKAITAAQVKQVVIYNKYDVDITEVLYNLSEDKIALRKTLYEKYGDIGFLSKGDTSLGADSFLIDLSEEMKIPINELRGMRTFYKSLPLKNVILPYIDKYLRDDRFKEVLNKYKNITLYPDEEGVLQLGGTITHELEFDDIIFKYGTGGLHASVDQKLFLADDDYLIIDVDVASFYPNIAIVNSLHPKHLSESFVKLYKKLYEERKLIPKSDPWNLAKKLSLNAIFGKSNSKYSYLYDTGFTLGITINGQLLLSILAEQLARCSRIIQVNTDGVTVMVHKSQRHLVEKVIKWWEKLTKLSLETAEYKQMAITDVNNYHAMYKDGSVKRKGRYTIYADYSNPKTKEYYKNPSALAISEALNNFYINRTPVNDTIYDIKNIHEFLIGYKKKSNFKFLLAKAKENGYIELKTNSDRVVRYYVANNGSSIYKITDKDGLTTLAKDLTLELAQNVISTDVNKYKNLNKEWYIDEAQKMIDGLELVNNEEFLKNKI